MMRSMLLFVPTSMPIGQSGKDPFLGAIPMRMVQGFSPGPGVLPPYLTARVDLLKPEEADVLNLLSGLVSGPTEL